MTRISKVTYQMVKTVADSLAEQGIYPSNDLVRAKTGGAANIVAMHLRRWREELEKAKLLKTTHLDDSIKIAIHDEIERQVKINTEYLENLLQQEVDSSQSMHNDLSMRKDEIDDLQKSISDKIDKHNQCILVLEKKYAELETRYDERNKSLAATESELEKEKRHNTDMVKRITQLEEQNNKLNIELNENLSHTSGIIERLHIAEKALAVAEARLGASKVKNKL